MGFLKKNREAVRWILLLIAYVVLFAYLFYFQSYENY